MSCAFLALFTILAPILRFVVSSMMTTRKTGARTQEHHWGERAQALPRGYGGFLRLRFSMKEGTCVW